MRDCVSGTEDRPVSMILWQEYSPEHSSGQQRGKNSKSVCSHIKETGGNLQPLQERKRCMHLWISKGTIAETTDMSWLHFGAKKAQRGSPMGSSFRTQEGSDLKRSSRIFLPDCHWWYNYRICGHGIYLEHFKVYDTVSWSAPESTLGDQRWDVKTTSK